MRVNIYSQELTSEVKHVRIESNTGIPYEGAQLMLHSSPMLHDRPDDDDRSAVTFWLPKSVKRREQMAQAFEEIAGIFQPRGRTVRDCSEEADEEAAGVLRDAARYRFLRDADRTENLDSAACTDYTMEALDEAIDDAMKQEKSK